MIIKKDYEIVKVKVERKSITLKAKKESSDEECLTFGSKDEEYTMAVRDFKKFFKIRGRFMRQPRNDKKTFQRSRDDKNGSWSDSGKEDDEKVKYETCLVAHASSEVCFESSYFSDENPSIDDLALNNEYDKLCKMSLKIITKNKRLKATRNSLENELKELKDKLSILEKNKGVDLDCAKCHKLKIKNEKLQEESTRLNKFEKRTHYLNEMLSNQKTSGDKLGLGFNSFESSSSGTKEIKFVKSKKKASSDGGPINMGGPQSVQAAPKIIMGLPPTTPRSEKTVSFLKSILGHRPKHIIVNKVKFPVASDNEVKVLYKPLSKPEICVRVNLEPDEWIKDSGCSKHMMGNQKLFSTYKAYNGGNVIFGSNLLGNIIGKGQICDNKCREIFSEHDSEITKDGKVIVPQPKNMKIIETKWVFRNKLDENGIVSQNKARLVAQGYNQQEGIAYDETYASVARLESIRILLAYACALDFKLFQMDVKSAFLNDFINEEVYVAQPLGFIIFEKPDHVYKSLMMKLMLRLQIKQMKDGIFFNQSTYIKEMFKKFGLEDSKPMKTLMPSDTKLTKDEECESVDSTKYRGMICSLLYLTASRPDIMFSVCLCARFQEVPKTSHLEEVKRIFRYIKDTTHFGLWYPKGTGIETVVYADSDHAGDYVDRKSTSGVCTFVGCCLTSWFSKKQTALAISTTEAEYVSVRKACQQALWMKQALIDYDVRRSHHVRQQRPD
nr:retrovirus-related Pol polyprotein from transposon TNT 1-94 [Tanacetum cinerariifolium]